MSNYADELAQLKANSAAQASGTSVPAPSLDTPALPEFVPDPKADELTNAKAKSAYLVHSFTVNNANKLAQIDRVKNYNAYSDSRPDLDPILGKKQAEKAVVQSTYEAATKFDINSPNAKPNPTAMATAARTYGEANAAIDKKYAPLEQGAVSYSSKGGVEAGLNDYEAKVAGDSLTNAKYSGLGLLAKAGTSGFMNALGETVSGLNIMTHKGYVMPAESATYISQKDQAYQRDLSSSSGFMKGAAGLVSMGAGMIPMVALGAIPYVGEVAAAAQFSAQIYGGAYKAAIASGQSDDKAGTSAAIQAIVTPLLMKATGGMGGALESVLSKTIDKAVTKVITNSVAQGVIKTGSHLAEAGFTGYMMALSTPVIENLVFNENKQIQPFSADKLESALQFAMFSGITRAVPYAIARFRGKNTPHSTPLASFVSNMSDKYNDPSSQMTPAERTRAFALILSETSMGLTLSDAETQQIKDAIDPSELFNPSSDGQAFDFGGKSFPTNGDTYTIYDEKGKIISKGNTKQQVMDASVRYPTSMVQLENTQKPYTLADKNAAPIPIAKPVSATAPFSPTVKAAPVAQPPADAPADAAPVRPSPEYTAATIRRMEDAVQGGSTSIEAAPVDKPFTNVKIGDTVDGSNSYEDKLRKSIKSAEKRLANGDVNGLSVEEQTAIEQKLKQDRASLAALTAPMDENGDTIEAPVSKPPVESVAAAPKPVYTAEQTAKLTELDQHHKETVTNINRSKATNSQEKGIEIKGVAMRHAAEKRVIIQGDGIKKVEGGLTETELSAKVAHLKTNYKGKKVMTPDGDGVVVLTAFGKIKVLTEHGTKMYTQEQLDEASKPTPKAEEKKSPTTEPVEKDYTGATFTQGKYEYRVVGAPDNGFYHVDSYIDGKKQITSFLYTVAKLESRIAESDSSSIKVETPAVKAEEKTSPAPKPKEEASVVDERISYLEDRIDKTMSRIYNRVGASGNKLTAKEIKEMDINNAKDEAEIKQLKSKKENPTETVKEKPTVVVEKATIEKKSPTPKAETPKPIEPAKETKPTIDATDPIEQRQSVINSRAEIARDEKILKQGNFEGASTRLSKKTLDALKQDIELQKRSLDNMIRRIREKEAKDAEAAKTADAPIEKIDLVAGEALYRKRMESHYADAKGFLDVRTAKLKETVTELQSEIDSNREAGTYGRELTAAMKEIRLHKISEYKKILDNYGKELADIEAKNAPVEPAPASPAIESSPVVDKVQSALVRILSDRVRGIMENSPAKTKFEAGDLFDVSTKQSPERDAAEAMAKIFKSKVSFFKTLQDAAKNVGGVQIKGVIYIKEGARNPEHIVAAHEIMHTLEDKFPVEFAAFKAIFKSEIDDILSKKYRDEQTKQYKNIVGQDLALENKFLSEAIADFMAEMFRRPEIVERIFSENKTLGQKLLEIIRGIGDSIREAVGSKDVSSFLKDLKKVEDAFVDFARLAANDGKVLESKPAEVDYKSQECYTDLSASNKAMVDLLKDDPKAISSTLKDLYESRDEIISEYVSLLRRQANQGVDQGNLTYDVEHNVVGRQGRVSRNKTWYSDQTEKGKGKQYINKKEYWEIAVKHLFNGYTDLIEGENPADQGFVDLQNIINSLNVIQGKPIEDFVPRGQGIDFKIFFDKKLSPDFVKNLDKKSKEIHDSFLNIHNAGTFKIKNDKGKMVDFNLGAQYMQVSEWNSKILSDPNWKRAASNMAFLLTPNMRTAMRIDGTGKIEPTKMELDFKMGRSIMQRYIDALPPDISSSTVAMSMDAFKESAGTFKTFRIAASDKVESVGGESYRRALVNEARRLFGLGKLTPVKLGALTKDDWGALGFLCANEKTGASGDFTTQCPQMMFMDGCFYCYRADALTTGVNNKLVAEKVWYTGDILRISREDVDKLNKSGGLRIQSFGDWMPHFSSQLADILLDADAMDLQVKIITKEVSMIDYVDQLKKQGLGKRLTFNISCDPNVEKITKFKDGDSFNMDAPFFREAEGGDPNYMSTYWKRALSIEEGAKLKEKYPFVNVRIVALNVDQFIRGLRDQLVDVVTGYHGNLKISRDGGGNIVRKSKEYITVTNAKGKTSTVRAEKPVRTIYDTETAQPLAVLEAVGNNGMPWFKLDKTTKEWSLDYKGFRDDKWAKAEAKFKKALINDPKSALERGIKAGLDYPIKKDGTPFTAYTEAGAKKALAVLKKSCYAKNFSKISTKLGNRILEEGLVPEYYRKACCIQGKCPKCEGKCGIENRKFQDAAFIKNLTNREPWIQDWNDQFSERSVAKVDDFTAAVAQGASGLKGYTIRNGEVLKLSSPEVAIRQAVETLEKRKSPTPKDGKPVAPEDIKFHLDYKQSDTKIQQFENDMRADYRAIGKNLPSGRLLGYVDPLDYTPDLWAARFIATSYGNEFVVYRPLVKEMYSRQGVYLQRSRVYDGKRKD